jgi:hypothetical protein
VLKLLSEEQKQERVGTSQEFVATIQHHSVNVRRHCYVDETMVSFYTPETKKQSQWIEKGKPGPINATLHVSRNKQLVMVIIDSQGLIYTHIIPKGSKINAIYIVKVLSIFIKKLRQKLPEMVSREWFFHWDNAWVHTATIVQAWIAANQVQD